MNYYISDPHFDYVPILEQAQRPFSSISEMNETLIDNWNRTVSDSDTVYLLGDLCGHGLPIPEDHLSRLKGKKHLIRGNHDTGLDNPWLLFQYFETVTDFLEIEDNGVHVVLCHYPIVYLQSGYMIHGHMHGAKQEAYHILKPLSRVMNASADIHHFCPVTLEELISDNQIFYESPGRGQLDDQPLRKKSKWAPDFRPLPQKQTSPKVLNIMQTRLGGNEK